MPIYEFEEVDTGERVELLMSVDDAVEPGAVVTIDGRRVRRLVVDFEGYVDNGGISTAVPKWDPLAPRHDKQGVPQFANKAEAKEYVRKFNARIADNKNYLRIDTD